MKAMFCSLVALLACGCALRNSPAAKSPAPPFVGAIQTIKHSIIPIACGQVVPEKENPDKGTPEKQTPGKQIAEPKFQLIIVAGTGFFVAADGTFLTANHVIDGMLQPNQQIPCPRTGFILPESGEWSTEMSSAAQPDFYEFDASACKRDKLLDLAHCRSKRAIDSARHIAPVTFEDAMQPDGTPIAFAGFQHQIPFTSIGYVSGYATPPNGPQEIIMDKPGWSGASGSPFFLANGKVVGMLQLSGTAQGPGRAMGRPSRLIQDFLRDAATNAKPQPQP